MDCNCKHNFYPRAPWQHSPPLIHAYLTCTVHSIPVHTHTYWHTLIDVHTHTINAVCFHIVWHMSTMQRVHAYLTERCYDDNVFDIAYDSWATLLMPHCMCSLAYILCMYFIYVRIIRSMYVFLYACITYSMISMLVHAEKVPISVILYKKRTARIGLYLTLFTLYLYATDYDNYW